MTEALQLALDRAELRHLAELYSQGADRRDKAIWQRIFAPEIVIEGPGFRNAGLADVVATLDTLDQMFRTTQHCVSNQIVAVQGDTASGETYCVADHLLKDADSILVWAIRYQDRWRREGETWLFTHRTLIVDWQETRPVALLES
ncbi:MAG: hypothetical protein RL317_1571 [Pseudomonadota bacterium]